MQKIPINTDQQVHIAYEHMEKMFNLCLREIQSNGFYNILITVENKFKKKTGQDMRKLHSHKFLVEMWIVSSFLESNLEPSINI